MKYTLSTICLFLLVICASCNDKNNAVNDHRGIEWSTLTITSEYDTDIIINNDGDTSVIKVYHTGSFFKPLPKNTKIKVDTLKAYFTAAEKDTIFSLVNDLIVHPVVTNRFCTEYVGSLKLTVDYGRGFKQTGEYSSVCDWNKLSEKSAKLHDVLRRKIKRVYLGEHDY